MSKTRRTSRQGLTQCPGCQAHVKAATLNVGASCDFCGTELGARPSAPTAGLSFVSRVARAGRSGLIAASLISAGCISGTPPSSDAPPQDTGAITDVAPDVSPIALYGMPADAVGPPDEVDDASETAPDVPDQALYGLPPEEE